MKNYLTEYKSVSKRLALVLEEIELLEIQMENPRGSILSEVASFAQGHKSDQIGAILSKYESLIALRDKLIKENTYYLGKINSLDLTEQEKIIVQHRYIENQPWKNVFNKIGCSPKHAFKIHKKIIKKAAMYM